MNEKNLTMELKQKCDNLAFLIANGFQPHDQDYYNRLWKEFASNPQLKAKRLYELRKAGKI